MPKTASRKRPSPSARPAPAGALARLRELAPDVADAYEALAARTRAASGLGDTSVALFKVAISVGQGSWRGVHAHARKALELGVEADVLRQIPIVALPSVGLHASLDALRWIEEIIEERRRC